MLRVDSSGFIKYYDRETNIYEGMVVSKFTIFPRMGYRVKKKKKCCTDYLEKKMYVYERRWGKYLAFLEDSE